MRTKVLQRIYRFFPFDLKADCSVPSTSGEIAISCIINFYGRLDLLSVILHSLAGQKYPHERFEIVLVEDKGGTEEGRRMIGEFAASLPIVYAPLDGNFGRMGYSRNFGLSRSRGKYVLFLDDDTVILQEQFLCKVVEVFERNPGIDAIVPHGNSSYGLIKGKYDFHDPYFMTSRCTAYRRTTLAELGGFVGDFIGQEDVEFVIRFIMAGKKSGERTGARLLSPPITGKQSA